MPELIAIFLAVMITDVILLDLFNTFGLPTSTTVSIVFELLGAAVAVSVAKCLHDQQSLLAVAEYINSGKGPGHHRGHFAVRGRGVRMRSGGAVFSPAFCSRSIMKSASRGTERCGGESPFP